MTDSNRLDLPYFVYGTLRPGYGNDVVWHGLATCLFDGQAWVGGYSMHEWGIPYAVRDAQALTGVTGALLYPAPGREESLRFRLDQLEGYPRHYDREVVTVRIGAGAPARPLGRLAWIYTPSSIPPGTRPVPSGDWSDVAGRDYGRYG